MPNTTETTVRRIPLAELHESPLNPRTRYDAAALEELMESLLQVGQLTPVVVRPRAAGGYELAAGHRRYRAAKRAVEQHAEAAARRGVDHLQAVVRELDDRAFVEVLNIENLQRDDLHPLEEAQGFRDLMAKAGYDVAKIAARIGRSARYVYDSLSLLKLVPEARRLFLADAFERGHAVELARLSPAWQAKALNRQINRYDGAGARGGLWQPEIFDREPGQAELKLADRVKPVSVRELKHWINDKVRVRPAELDPVLFPEARQALDAATAAREQVIEITYEYTIWHEARSAQAPRVYGAQAWRSATRGHPDPEGGVTLGRAKDGRPCPHSVIGVVVIGPGRGTAFRVCIAKEQCKVHWADWQRQRARRQRTAKYARAPVPPAAVEPPPELYAEELKQREPAILAQIAAIAEGLTDDELVWNLTQSGDPAYLFEDGWYRVGSRTCAGGILVNNGGRLDRYEFRDHFAPLLTGKAGGAWPRDLKAAKACVALEIFIARDAHAHAESIEAAVRKRWKAAQQAERAKAPAAKTPKAAKRVKKARAA